MKRRKTQILNPRDTVLIAALTLFLSACISDGSPSPPLAAKVIPTTTAGNGTSVARLQETVSLSAALCPVTWPPEPNRNRFAMALTSERLVKRGIPGTPAVFETMYRE